MKCFLLTDTATLTLPVFGLVARRYFAGRRRSQFLFDPGDIAHGLRIRLFGRLPAHVGCGDDENLMPNVIKRQQPVKEHQVAVGNLQIVFGYDRELFNLADSIMGKESDSAGGKRRQSGNGAQEYAHARGRQGS